MKIHECIGELIQELAPDQGQSPSRALALVLSLQAALTYKPEAPKVEQEPTHKAAVIDAIEDAISKPIDADGWTRQVAAETAYNYLLHGGHLRAQPEAPKVEQGLVGYLEGAAIADLRNGFASVTATVYSKAESGCEAIYTHPAPASDELLEAATALVGIVDGVGVLNHGKWTNEHGLRLKDTPEWGAFYNANSSAKHKGPQS